MIDRYLLPLFVLIVAGFMGEGCKNDPPPVIRPSTEAGTATCADACANLGKLGCSEAGQPDGGLACVDVCVKASASSPIGPLPGPRLDPDCVASAVDVATLRTFCNVRCKNQP